MDNPSTHPNPHPVLHHRKIDLQSPADLTHLQTLLAQSAREKLDRHLPPVALPATHISLGGQPLPSNDSADRRESDTHLTEDDLRRTVRLLIDEYLHTTWTSAAQNIAVNGIDAHVNNTSTSNSRSQAIPNCTNPAPETQTDEQEAKGDGNGGEVEEREGVHFTYAAFDPRLQKKLASLHGELEVLTAQVSKLRREAPGKAAGVYAEGLSDAIENDESAWGDVQGAEMDLQEMEVEVGGPKQGWADVRTMYEGGVGQLAGLGTGLTETVGRGQRAGRVVGELE